MAKLYDTDISTVLVFCLLRMKMVEKQLNYRWLKTLGGNSHFFLEKKIEHLNSFTPSFS